MKKVFYTISLSRKFHGIGSVITSVMNRVVYALEKGYIPIIDFKHYDNLYFKEKRRYRDNAWEYFFKQPFGYDLKDIEQNIEYDVIISESCHETGSKYDFYVSMLPVKNNSNENEILNEIKAYYQKYIIFSDDMKNFIDNCYKKFKIENKLSDENISDNVLGVLVRGTDYTQRKTEGHPIQPEFEDIKNHIVKVLQSNPEIKYIYVATEDKDVYSKFEEEFGEILLKNNQYMYVQSEEEKKQLLCDIQINRQNHHYNLAKEYLFSLYLLTKFNYFVAGRCNGSALVWLMAKSLRYCYIYDLGVYPSLKKTNNSNAFYNNIFERFFSVRNDSNHIHKIVTLFGVRMKFRI